MSFRRTHLGWLWELAHRKRDAKYWREFGEEAPTMPLEEFIHRGWSLVNAHSGRRDEILDLSIMGHSEPLRYRLLIERDLNTTLKEFAEEPKGGGQFEFELHHYRWVLSLLPEILRGALYKAEAGQDPREEYSKDSASDFAELDKALPLLETATDDELYQAVHKLVGRAHLS